MNIKKIEMSTYKRKAAFDYFLKMGNPYAGMTANVDITIFMKNIKNRELPFFLTFLHTVGNTANSIQEFRHRIVDGEIIEYASCPTSHTVLLEDETYCYCPLDCIKPLDEFLPYAVEEQERAKLARNMNDEGIDGNSLLFISSMPWFTYTSIVQPTPTPPDSNPRITWGRYFKQDGKILIPVTLLVHHSLMDGLHMSKFYQALQENLNHLFITDF